MILRANGKAVADVSDTAFDMLKSKSGRQDLNLRPLLLLHTDGIAEARAPHGEFFPLAAWMRRQPPTPPRELLTALHRDLLRYSRGRLDDDIAALAVRLGKP